MLNSALRFPARMNKEQFFPVAYSFMYLSRQMDLKFKELFRKGHVKGTVIISAGNEATTVGMSLPFRPGKDIMSLLHRDIGAHLVSGTTPLSVFCQHMANENSPTHAREGNVHYGNAQMRRFPMISHLGDMLAPTVGGVWAARYNNENVFGLTTIGDGGSSTGDFHESINIASVQKVPVLFLIENNGYAYSTPVENQYKCKQLSDRALGYGIEGKTIDGTDVWEVYNAVCDALEGMSKDSLPRMIECMTLRLEGHAAYDNAEYVPEKVKAGWLEREPIGRARLVMLEIGYSESEIAQLEEEIATHVQQETFKALQFNRPVHSSQNWSVYAPAPAKTVKPFKAENVRNLNAINSALDYLLSENANAVVFGQDIGVYESPFKSCKGLYKKFGPKRVVDTPVCESATAGLCLGASQTGVKPIMEFQFADFSTEAVTQIGLNAGTWYFRTGVSAPIVYRLPCGGGITLGAFHSGEFEGLWSRFPGLKLFYPVTPQECFEALVAAFHDPNPCIVFEHKLLYWGKQDSISFDGELATIERPRCYTTGTDLTIVAFGAMVDTTLSIVNKFNYSVQLWNPFILNPLKLEPIIESVRATGRLLVIQESGETAGLGDRIISILGRKCFKELKCAPELVSSPDVPVPFAKELEIFHIPSQDRICEAIESMIGAKSE
jgi:2-oxoisovalerate dehydrogenase E1 component